MVIKSLHFLVGITLSLAYKITQPYKNWQRHTLAPLAFRDGPHSAYWSVYLPAQTFFHLEKKKNSPFSVDYSMMVRFSYEFMYEHDL